MKKLNREQKNDGSMVCLHCHEKFDEARIIGITPICPSCNKPSDSLLD